MHTEQEQSKVVAFVSALLDTPEAAAYLGNLKPATLEQWRWTGKGPRFVKIGRNCRYRKADLDSYIDERVYGSTTEAQAA